MITETASVVRTENAVLNALLLPVTLAIKDGVQDM